MLWSLVAAPLVTGSALLLSGRRADAHAGRVAVGATAVTLALSIVVALRRPAVVAPYLEGVSFGLAVDGLSAVLVVTVAVALLAVLVFALGEFGPGEARARFYGLMLLFAGAMLVTVTATTLVTLLMAWEVMGAMSYALIGYWWRESRRARSGAVAFLTTRAADLGLYLAAGAALAGGAGGLELTALAELPDGWRDVVVAGVVVAALGKSAQLPFSFWLSRAMDGPSPVSALLHSATMVAAGAYLLLRLDPLLAATAWAGVLVAWLGALTALVLGAVATVQQDLKQLLAASTCAQVGFMVLAAGAGGVASGAGQLVAHALTKTLLFLAAGAWLTALGTKELGQLRGAARRYPWVGGTFTVGALTLAGIPPLSLWATKDEVLAVALRASTPLYLLGLAAAALSAVYAIRALVLVWSPSPAASHGHHGRQLAGVRGGPLTALAAGAAVLGVLALHPVWSAFADVVSDAGASTPRWWEYLVSAGVALAAAGLAAGVVRQRGDLPGQASLRSWLGLEELARTTVAVPARVTAGVLARFDDRIVDGGVRATATAGTTLARLTTARPERWADGAVRAVAHGFRRLGRLARRPQTGQLHHYYAQAVVVLAALAVLLIVL